MIVTDLARMYPTATGREVQRAMVEGSSHLHERKAGHVDNDTRRTVRKAWESLGCEPEPWMRAGGARRQPGARRGRVGVTLDVPHRRGWPERGDAVRGAATGAGHTGAGEWRES